MEDFKANPKYKRSKSILIEKVLEKIDEMRGPMVTMQIKKD